MIGQILWLVLFAIATGVAVAISKAWRAFGG